MFGDREFCVEGVKWLYTIDSGIIHLVHRLGPLNESEGQTRVYTKVRGGLG